MKTILITGATSGIGLASAKKFAENGWNLILTGRRKERLEEIKKELSGKKVDVKTIVFDVRNRKEVEAALAGIDHVDVLLNNAGLAAGLDPIHKGDIEDWERMIDTNVKGLLYVSRIISGKMVERRSGHIINIGSIAGKEVYPNGNVYCATKHAVDALTKSMRIDLLPFGIKVTGVCPGLAETEFSVVRFHGDTEKAKLVYQGLEPLTGADIAEVIYFAATCPENVCLNDVVVMPKAQASSRDVVRK